MSCREEGEGIEGEGRGSAQRTLGQWWPVRGLGVENKNWGLPVGALVVVWKDAGGALNQQQGELGEGTALTQGGGLVGLLVRGRFWGCFSSNICLVLSYAGGKHPPFSLPLLTPSLSSALCLS